MVHKKNIAGSESLPDRGRLSKKSQPFRRKCYSERGNVIFYEFVAGVTGIAIHRSSSNAITKDNHVGTMSLDGSGFA